VIATREGKLQYSLIKLVTFDGLDYLFYLVNFLTLLLQRNTGTIFSLISSSLALYGSHSTSLLQIYVNRFIADHYHTDTLEKTNAN
jgi:hypothetical protein